MKITISGRQLFFMAIEALVAGAVAWKLFVFFIHQRGPRLLRLPLALYFALSVEGILVDTYVQIAGALDRARRHRSWSLRRRLWWAWRVRFNKPIIGPAYRCLFVLGVLDAMAWMTSAPVALPVVSTLILAAVTAGVGTFYRHVDLS